jgi:molybdopterin converting factor subunit 1
MAIQGYGHGTQVGCKAFMIKTIVLLFAHFADAVGSGRLDVDLEDPATVQDCSDQLVSQYPALGDLLKIGRAAVNGEFAAADQALQDGDEVAFLPPVSGG